MSLDWLEEMRHDAQQEYIKRLQSMTYWDYLRSAHWKQVRRDALRRAGYACVWCADDGWLNVHHLHYDSIGCETEDDILVLCVECHESVSPVRRTLLASIKSLSVQKGVDFVPPENLRHAKQLEQELLALPDYVPPEHVSFYRLVAALAGDVWPWTPFGVLEAIRQEKAGRTAEMIPNLGPIPRSGKEREWDGVALASNRRGKAV